MPGNTAVLLKKSIATERNCRRLQSAPQTLACVCFRVHAKKLIHCQPPGSPPQPHWATSGTMSKDICLVLSYLPGHFASLSLPHRYQYRHCHNFTMQRQLHQQGQYGCIVGTTTKQPRSALLPLTFQTMLAGEQPPRLPQMPKLWDSRRMC